METPQDLQKPCVLQRTIAPLYPEKCPHSCKESCSAFFEMSHIKVLLQNLFSHFGILLCWYHKNAPEKAIVSWQCRSPPHQRRCSPAPDPRPGTLGAGNPVGLQLCGERDLGGTSCCP